MSKASIRFNLAIDTILTVVNSALGIWALCGGHITAFISFLACVACVLSASLNVSSLIQIKRRERLEDMYREIFTETISIYSDIFRETHSFHKKRGEIPQNRIEHLALHHRKMRVRKKNQKRIKQKYLEDTHER